MKKLVLMILSAAMTFSLLASSLSVSAAVVRVKVITEGGESVAQTVSTESEKVSLTQSGDNVIAKTKGGTDQWIDVHLPNIDTSIYDSFTVKYKSIGPIASNSIYMRGKTVNTSYSPTAGTYMLPGIISNGEWQENTYNVDTDFPYMAGSVITGIRIPVCANAGDTFELESVTFTNSRYFPSVKEYEGTYPKQTGKVFGGWFADMKYTSKATGDAAYAKFVDKNAHKVKWQIKNRSEDGSVDIRFVTTIDDLNYRNVGFAVTYDGKTANVQTKKAYSKLKAAGDSISPSVFSDQSKYFVSFILTDVPAESLNNIFEVQAYWTTLDGTQVKGDKLMFTVNEPDGAVARVVKPGTGSVISILTDEMTNWFVNYTPADMDDLCDCTEKCEPLPVILKWDGDENVLYTHVLLSVHEDMSDPDIYLCLGDSVMLEDLYVGTTYYWQLRKEYKDKAVMSKVNSFETMNTPRTIRLDGISNVRDIGGYVSSDGRYRIKQGIVYRGADFARATDEGISKAVNELGIKTEIDLREADPSGKSPLGTSVKYIAVSAPWYTGVWDDKDRQTGLVKAMRILADESNYPLYFHCSLGRDRTGTFAFFVTALCDIPLDSIMMDYEVSFFSDFGGYDDSAVPSVSTNGNFKVFISRLLQETGETSIYDAARSYLKSKGMTDEELDAIRANLLEEVR